MYHFTADHPAKPVRLSIRSLIRGHIRQYLKDFQLDAIRFMHNFLAKEDFCVYNDESGLGKQASVAVLLDAACTNRKCLIIVQNDDRYINGWQFHLNVLTNTNIMVIKDEKDSTDSAHNIYIAKWSTLRTIDDLSKFKFDFIIIDNRGQMLNNSFCTSMLLKHYERKINILISSVDITSDLKLLHNVLRLGGRLEPQYFSFKTFEEKFKLPDAKELAYKRVDLEEYFCKRERLADYCKDFRLRRYCHQFEAQLPLVKEDRYKINLDLWREKQNNTNSESSSIEFVNNQNREDQHNKDTQELFEEYCRQRRKQHLQFQQEEEKRLLQREREMLKSLHTDNEIIYNVDDEVALINNTPPTDPEYPPDDKDNSDELLLMSPLLVESDSDVEDIPEVCHDHDDIEIVDLSSDGKEEAEQRNQSNQIKNKTYENSQPVEENNKSESCSSKKIVSKRKKRSELDRLDEDIVSALKITETPKRPIRYAKGEVTPNSSAKRLKDRLEGQMVDNVILKRNESKERAGKTIKASVSNTLNNKKISIKTEIQNDEKFTQKSKTISNKTQKSPKENFKATPNVNKSKEKSKREIPIDLNLKKTTKRSTPEFTNTKFNSNSKAKQSRITNDLSETTPVTTRKYRFVKNEEISPNANNTQMQIKQEISEETPQTKKINTKKAKVNSEIIRLKRELEITPLGIHTKQTRSMQRLTRSAGSSSKYFIKNISLKSDKTNKPKKKLTDKKVSSKSNTNKTKKAVEEKTQEADKNTQLSIISHRSSQDYESLQCAQRLSDVSAFDNGLEKSMGFLVPPTPNATEKNSLIPLSLSSTAGFLTDSDVIFIAPSNPVGASSTYRKRDAGILLSSSENENSTSQTSSSNISMTSRRTRALKPKRNQLQVQSETSKVPSFSDFLPQQNARTNAKSPDLFSNCSDLVQLPCTQPNLDTEEPHTPFEGFKIFGSEVKQLQQHYAFSKNNNTNKTYSGSKRSYREQRSCLDILEKMFEPSNKKVKEIINDKSSSTTHTKKVPTHRVREVNKGKPQTHILPSHPVEAIAEARHQQELQNRKRSKNATSNLHDDEIFEITNNGTFGSVIRLHSNGDISPVQCTQKNNTKQHNKITNYLIGNNTQNANSGSQDEINISNINAEPGTPSKRHQQPVASQNSNGKKSPKSKSNSTQATKLTKWFTKPSDLISQSANNKKSSNSKKIPTKQVQQQVQQQVNAKVLTTTATSPTPIIGKRILKRRRLDLSFNK